ncbi:TolC family protein [Lysobacter sp. TY2-98]|uniref:efflux transporter outer membrane subunit n=1 Tax=Lysobacter sp. TY2-98 TaxID=2290922 RepID=UPI000E204EDA|nr:efflux transporter outer membrane subunit [Lysobacter sp. TY2-98]AXK72403.1 TolC family protein [Lysobacter sp. TY2-98]
MLLASCATLGPDYKEPDVAWLKDWQSDLYGLSGSPDQQTQVDLRFWWKAFNDPVLDGLIETARRESPSLRIAGLRILESRAVLGIAGATLYPQVQQLSGSASYVEQSRTDGKVSDRDQHFASYGFGFDLGWELDFWRRFRRSIESAEAGFFASITNQQDAQVLLSAQVASLYYAYRTTRLRIDIAHKNADIQKRSLEITERLFKSGEESELDLQQAKSQYLGTLALIPDLEADATKLRNAMAVVLGRMPGDVPELTSRDQPLPTIASTAITSELPANLLMRRPDVRTAAWQVAAQSAQIGVAKADYFPAITLLGSLRWSTTSQEGSPVVHSIGAGPAFNWPIFDYGRIRNNVRLQDARLQQAIEHFQNSTLVAAQEIDDAAITVIKTGEEQVPLSAAARAAERSLQLANTQYNEGYAGFERVLDAQRVMFSQSERELLNQSAHVSAVITLYKAIGGGWTEMPMGEMVGAPARAQMQSRTNWGDLLTAPLPSAAASTSPEDNKTGEHR